MTARLSPRLERALRLLVSRPADGAEGTLRGHLALLFAELDKTRADLEAALEGGTSEWGVRLDGSDYVQEHGRPDEAVKVADELAGSGATPLLLHRTRLLTPWRPCSHPKTCTCTPEEGA
ncbi:hypothetical protein [Streptomyces sp. NPDC003832]